MTGKEIQRYGRSVDGGMHRCRDRKKDTGLMYVFFLGFFQSLGTLVKLLVSELGIGSPSLSHAETPAG